MREGRLTHFSGMITTLLPAQLNITNDIKNTFIGNVQNRQIYRDIK